MNPRSKDGKRSALPPMTELAARCRDGATLRGLAAELGVALSTLTARFSAAGFAASGETIQQAKRRELRESLTRENRPEWMDESACLNHHPDLWFADTGNALARARAICGVCPVASLCLERALEKGEQYGVFGGLTYKERISLKRRTAYWANRKEGAA